MNVVPRTRSMDTGATKRLAAHVAAIRYDRLDARTSHRAKYHTLDSIGAVLAGATQEVTGITERALLKAGTGGRVPVAGRKTRMDMLSAAFLNGTAGHGLELDDGYRAGSVHPGTVVVPALLAAAAVTGSNGKAAIAGVVAGYEVMCRLAAAMHPRARWRGFHNTSTTGPFGAAALWGVLKGFDARGFAQAFGTAASTSSGLFAFMGGGDVKRLHPGFAARSGLLAGLVAEEGLEGSPDALECADGFFQAYGGGDAGYDYSKIDITKSGPGSPYAITECYIKPYACCRHIHAPIDGVLKIMKEHRLKPDDVESIHVASYKVAAAHDLKEWDAFTTAQMSIPYVVATTVRHGGADLEHFSPAHRADPATAALAAKVAVSVDAQCDKDYPAMRPAVTTIRTRGGKDLSLRVDNPYGEPEVPLDDAALSAKFMKLAVPVIGARKAEQVAEAVWSLEKVADLRPLVEDLAGKA